MKDDSKASKNLATVDPMERTTLAGVPEKVWPITLGSFLMAALCAACLWPAFGEINAIESVALWVGLVFFGGGGALIALQGVGFYQPVITLSPQGFTATRVAFEMVPWSSVLGIRTWSFAGSTIIVVKITDEAWRPPGISLTPRLTPAANRWLGIDGLAISALGMRMPAKHIVKMFRAYRQAHRRRDPKVLDSDLDVAPKMRSRGEMT